MRFDPKSAIQVKALKTEFDRPASCFLNAHDQVKAKGGRAVFCWLKGDVLLNCIQVWVHHCIWESPEGELFELTPFVGTDNLSAGGYGIFWNEEATVILDPDARLLELPDGFFKTLLPEYEAIVQSGKVREAIRFFKQADLMLVKGDMEGEAYWCRMAGEKLGGWVAPYGETGLKSMLPFQLPN